jgi:hypothetical protein
VDGWRGWLANLGCRNVLDVIVCPLKGVVRCTLTKNATRSSHPPTDTTHITKPSALVDFLRLLDAWIWRDNIPSKLCEPFTYHINATFQVTWNLIQNTFVTQMSTQDSTVNNTTVNTDSATQAMAEISGLPLWKRQRFFPSALCSECMWSPCNLLSNEYQKQGC